MSITSIRRPFSRAAAAALACASVAAAWAAPEAPAANSPYQSHRVTIDFKDLNLGTEAGATTLYRRIAAAAQATCGPQGYGLFEQRVWKRCFQHAVGDAVASVNSPLLTSVHRRINHADVTAMNTK